MFINYKGYERDNSIAYNAFNTQFYNLDTIISVRI
jgi:hypothetical protein